MFPDKVLRVILVDIFHVNHVSETLSTSVKVWQTCNVWPLKITILKHFSAKVENKREKFEVVVCTYMLVAHAQMKFNWFLY